VENTLSTLAQGMTNNTFMVKQSLESMKTEGEMVLKLMESSEDVKSKSGANSSKSNPENVGDNVDAYL